VPPAGAQALQRPLQGLPNLFGTSKPFRCHRRVIRRTGHMAAPNDCNELMGFCMARGHPDEQCGNSRGSCHSHSGEPSSGNGCSSTRVIPFKADLRCTAARRRATPSHAVCRQGRADGAPTRRRCPAWFSSQWDFSAVSCLPEAPMTVPRNLPPMRVATRLDCSLPVRVFEHSVSAQIDVPVSD
jgi:hypothetical protein